MRSGLVYILSNSRHPCTITIGRSSTCPPKEKDPSDTHLFEFAIYTEDTEQLLDDFGCEFEHLRISVLAFIFKLSVKSAIIGLMSVFAYDYDQTIAASDLVIDEGNMLRYASYCDGMYQPDVQQVIDMFTESEWRTATERLAARRFRQNKVGLEEGSINDS